MKMLERECMSEWPLSDMQSYPAGFRKIPCMWSCVNVNRDQYSGKSALAIFIVTFAGHCLYGCVVNEHF